MNLPESVGSRIRELRKAKEWTQEQLAEDHFTIAI